MPRGSQPRVFCRQVGLSPLSAFDPGKTGIWNRSGFVGLAGNAGFLMRLGLILGCMYVGPVWEQVSGCWSSFLLFHRGRRRRRRGRALGCCCCCCGEAAGPARPLFVLPATQSQTSFEFHELSNSAGVWSVRLFGCWLAWASKEAPPLWKALLPPSDNNTYSLVGGGGWGISHANKVSGSCAQAFSGKKINKKGLKKKARMIWKLEVKKDLNRNQQKKISEENFVLWYYNMYAKTGRSLGSFVEKWLGVCMYVHTATRRDELWFLNLRNRAIVPVWNLKCRLLLHNFWCCAAGILIYICGGLQLKNNSKNLVTRFVGTDDELNQCRTWDSARRLNNVYIICIHVKNHDWVRAHFTSLYIFIGSKQGERER